MVVRCSEGGALGRNRFPGGIGCGEWDVPWKASLGPGTE